MAIGLYIHVPFCVKKCLYCDFTSYPYNPSDAQAYLKAIRREMHLYRQLLTGDERELSSLFIGGGTPTCLAVGELKDMLEEVRRVFKLLPGSEITVETNPGAIDWDGFSELFGAGVNRLSIGVQSFQDDLLKVLGRIHDAGAAAEAVQLARAAGFKNINLDFIFGIPGQTAGDWLDPLRRGVDLFPEHIAVYGLQLEEGTPLEQAVARGKRRACPEDLELSMYRTAISLLTGCGYEHYEISNFARPGGRSSHNLKYWLNHPYLGLGAGAHSSFRGERFSNETSLERYLEKAFRGEYPVKDRELISVQTAMSESMFLGLRLIQGVNLDLFYRRFGRRVENVYGKQIARLAEQGLIEVGGGHLRLSERGLPVANRVFQEFV